MAVADPSALRIRTNDPIPFAVADGTAIVKGDVLQLTDPMTASAQGNGTKVAGIAARDKVANDGRTQLACFRRGFFDMKCSGAVNIGDPLQAYNNDVMSMSVTASGASIIGTAMETGADDEVIVVDVNVGAGGAGGIS